MRQKLKASNKSGLGVSRNVALVLFLNLFTVMTSQAQQAHFKVFAHRGF
jgi:hypothetical protein